MRVVYLHGFASSAGSRKAQFFQGQLAGCGIKLETPDLAAGDFEHLTIGGQLRVVTELLQGEAAVLVGSSLGGYLAALYASRHPEIARVILLAPAFRFRQHWAESIGAEGMERWRATNHYAVYHYGEKRMRELKYEFMEDSLRWDPEPEFPQPGWILHGTKDTVVPARYSVEYAARRPRVELRLVESDHELTDALEKIWAYLGCAVFRSGPER